VTETGPGWTLHNADCLGPEGLSTLADKSVDHVITDPPYCETTHSRRNMTRHLEGYEVPAIDFGSMAAADTEAVADALLRATKRWVLAFTSDRGLGPWIDAFAEEFVRTLVWIKTDPMPQMTGDRPAHGFEVVAAAHRNGRKRWNGGGSPGTYTGHRGDGKRGHPTQKPIWLMLALVSDFTDPGELVCDPFAGSGTTGVACIQLGRRFVGWERDPKYFAVAVKRLRAAREQLGLFDRPAVEKFKQATLTGTDT
jgi:site-specific DNA-methyltransferase (adenine-specific)